MNKTIQLQENLFEYFEDVSDIAFINFVDSFTYRTPTKIKENSELIEKFIKDNGLFTAIANEKYDEDHPDSYFKRSTLSQTSMLHDIRMCLISISHNRFRNSLRNKKTTLVKTKRRTASNSSKNKKNFEYIKRQLLECYESLNRSESYFYGEKEDAEFVKKIEKLEFK